MADTNSPPNPTIPTIFGQLIAGVPSLIMIGIVIALVVGGFMIFNYIKDVQAQVQSQTAITQTLAQKFNQLGPNGAVQTGNTQATAPQVNTQASDAFGVAVLNAMRCDWLC